MPSPPSVLFLLGGVAMLALAIAGVLYRRISWLDVADPDVDRPDPLGKR